MSIRKEHLEAYDSALNSLQENIDLGKSLMMSKDDITKKIESGFNLIGNLGQAYQGVQTTKALLNKGSNVAKKVSKPVEQSQEQARTTDTGSEETPTTQPDENITRTPFTQEREMQEFSRQVEEGGEMGETSFGAETTTQTIAPAENLDQLAPMRAMMEQNAQPLAPTETQTRMMDFDPEDNITDMVNTSGTTRAVSGVENTVDEVGNTVTPAVEDVSNTISTASKVLPEATEALDLTAGATAEIPVIGEAVAIFAGIGSAIASAFGDKEPSLPNVAQVGADFSNTDEHSGAALSAY